MSSDASIILPETAINIVSVAQLCPLAIVESEIPLRSQGTMDVPGGTYIFREGSIPDSVLIFKKGVAELLVEDKADGARRLRTVGPDEVFGLTECIACTPYVASLCAVSDCRFECLKVEELESLLQNSHELRSMLIQRLADGLQNCLKSFRTKGISNV